MPAPLLRRSPLLFVIAVSLLPLVSYAQPAGDGEPRQVQTRNFCRIWERVDLPRNPTDEELRCRYGARGPGRFGLSEYMDVPVYQPATPLPGTHVVGVPGLPRPHANESYEEWEWRVLRTEYAPRVRNVHRELELLDPVFAARLIQLESRLREAGIRFTRRETWRSPERQEWLFQQGRSRPGPMVTATLTSWHSQLDERGNPFSRAADYNVSRGQMARFHEIAWSVGLESYGPDSNDPGHVYLPGAEDFPSDQLIYLRLLPRVPSVTIATGRPTDERVDRHLRAEFRLASHAFAWEPFLPHPRRMQVAGLAIPTAPVQHLGAPPPPLDLRIDHAEPQGALGALVAWIRGRHRR
jgi:hypothetical protein